MNKHVEVLVRNQVAKLLADNEFLVRQIQVKAQRLDDLKVLLRENLAELESLRVTLSAVSQADVTCLTPTPTSGTDTDGCKYHSSPEPNAHAVNELPQHTNIIVG
jgi:hypothetical protein